MSYWATIEALEWLPALVRVERLRRGLSLRTAAAEIGYTYADLCRFENGSKDVRVSTAVAMLRWLDADPEQTPQANASQDGAR